MNKITILFSRALQLAKCAHRKKNLAIKLLAAKTHISHTYAHYRSTAALYKMADQRADLEEESKSFTEISNESSETDISLSVDALRACSEQSSQIFKGDFQFLGSSEEKLISTTDGGADYQIPMTILKPELETGRCWGKVLIYFHGGGWVLCSRNTHMKFCEMIASQCKCVVVNVEYRLSPEYKFPACYVDAQAVVQWCLSNKKLLTNNESALVGVAGDSAGANISASVCHLVKGLDFQVLIYPSLSLSKRTEYPSYMMYSEGFLFTKQLMAWFLTQFLNNKDEAKNPICSPMNRSEFTGLPPALFIVSECDPFADQSTEYEENLKSAGVKTEFVMLKGTVHGFVNKPGHFKGTTSKTMKYITDFLSKL